MNPHLPSSDRLSLLEDGIQVEDGDVSIEGAELIAYLDSLHAYVNTDCITNNNLTQWYIKTFSPDLRLCVEFEEISETDKIGLEFLMADVGEKWGGALREWVESGKASEVGKARKVVR